MMALFLEIMYLAFVIIGLLFGLAVLLGIGYAHWLNNYEVTLKRTDRIVWKPKRKNGRRHWEKLKEIEVVDAEEIKLCCKKKCNEPVYNLDHCFKHWNIANQDF